MEPDRTADQATPGTVGPPGDPGAEGDRWRTRMREVASGFSPRSLPGTVAGGLITGFVAVAVTISFAAIVFSGPLEEHLPQGIGLALFGSAAIGLITALGSSFRVALAGVQDNVTAILAVAVAAVAVRVGGTDALPTVLATIVAASGLMGVLLYLVGRLHVGGLIRYMPYPVVGGFLAATGVLLVDGGWEILTAGRAASDLFDPHVAMVWGPGTAVGVAMYLTGRLRPRTVAAPALLLAAIVVLRVGFAVFGVGRDEAMARGWLFGPFPGGVGWSPRTMRLLGDAEWSAVAGEWVALVTIAVVAAVSVLLYVHALEHETDHDVDVDRELRVAGVAGIASGAGGGFPGFLYFSDSALLQRITGPRRAAAALGAGLNLAVLAFGAVVLDLVPRAVIGGVVLGLGLAFVIEWLWDARRTLGRVDHGLVFIIAAATVVAGFLAAIAFGVVIAIALFVVRYSRVEVVRRTYGLDRISSTLARTREQQEALAEHGRTARIVEVQGFLFFGTASGLFNERWLGPEPDGPDVRYVVFDMSGVTGMDSSMAMAFPRVDRAAQRRGVSLVVAGVPERLRRRVEAALDRHSVVLIDDLDAALIWCEDRILDGALGSHEAPDSADLAAVLEAVLGEGGAESVLRHTSEVRIAAGDRLISTGETPRGLYFLESGRLRVVLERRDGPPVLLRQLLPGTILGEVGLYQGDAASATVIADTDCRLRLLASRDLVVLDRADPAAAAAVHHFAATVLADRVLHAERGLRSER